MSNDYYNHGSYPAPGTPGSSAQLRAEFEAVEVGFTGVQASLTSTNTTVASKGAIAGQTWTGTHTFPSTTYGVTAAPGANGNSFATLDYVNSVAMSPVLPGQAGKAGMTLVTDGATARWDLVSYVPRRARTSNVEIGSGDRGGLIDITSGSFAQTFASVAALVEGWQCFVRNSGTGDITLTPAPGQLIDGLTSYVMYPGECRLIQCDGTAFHSIVVSPFRKQFLTSGNFIKPPGYRQFAGLLWGGGGSGARGSDYGSTGGGGGACVPFSFRESALGSSTSVLIGSGGAASGIPESAGSPGNPSTFSGVTAYGGGGGTHGTSGTFFLTGGAGGGAFSVGSNGNGAGGFSRGGLPSVEPSGSGSGANALLDNHGYGGGGANPNYAGSSIYGGGAGACYGAAAGNSIFGGAGGGAIDGASTQRAAGTSKYGGSGGGSSASTAQSGAQPGGGGGASYGMPGAGGAGMMEIWGVA